MKKEDLEELQQDVEDIADSLSTSQNIRNILFTVAAVMIGFGQWNDSKELAVEIYEKAISAFTHNVEYAQIDEISVGITHDYFESIVGAPKVIKPSRINEQIQYEYTFNDKYLLTSFFQNERLVGYSVIALIDDFSPHLPFSENTENPQGNVINNLTLDKMSLPLPETYTNDYRNISFFIENHELDITGLFLKRSVGYVNYSQDPNDNFINLVMELQDAQMFESDTTSLVSELREYLIPNFFAIGDISPQLFADALLTKYEYHKFR